MYKQLKQTNIEDIGTYEISGLKTFDELSKFSDELTEYLHNPNIYAAYILQGQDSSENINTHLLNIQIDGKVNKEKIKSLINQFIENYYPGYAKEINPNAIKRP